MNVYEEFGPSASSTADAFLACLACALALVLEENL